MSVTESTVKAVKKTTRKARSVANDSVLSAVLAQTEEQTVPLSALVKSPLNVRTVPYSADSVRELAESVRGIGLLQNLVVHTLPDGLYGVAAGGRRLAALNLLAANGDIAPDWPVRVKIIPEDLAVAASLTENGQRRDTHPAEQIAGFRAMAEEGKTPAQIGDLLGYSAKHVQRMLKLAGLAPLILQALAEDTITTEHCQALALENDPDRQVQVYEAACCQGWDNKPEVRVIRNLITGSEVSTHNNSKFRFVGESAFAPDEVRADLFSDEQGGYVDSLALDTVLLEKLHFVAECLKEAEGWSWATGRMDSLTYYGDDAKVYQLQTAPEAVYTEQEAQRLEELQELYDENQTASAETDAMVAEMAAIDCAAEIRAWTPEQRAGSGVVVSWQYGEVQVRRGVVLREQTEDEDGNEAVTGNSAEKTPEPVDAISLPLLTKMSSERTLAVQTALMQQPEKAVSLMVWRLCTCVFSHCITTRHPFVIRLEVHHSRLVSEAPTGESGTAWQCLMQEKARLEALLPEGWERDFTTFFALDGQTLMDLMAFCTACSVDGVQTRNMGHTTRSDLDGVETALGFHLRDWWQPESDSFFSHMKKTQIVAALKEAGLTGAAKQRTRRK